MSVFLALIIVALLPALITVALQIGYDRERRAKLSADLEAATQRNKQDD